MNHLSMLDVCRVREHVHEGTVVVDFGADVGDFTCEARAAGAGVLAVEPNPKSCETISGRCDVVVVQAALGPGFGAGTLDGSAVHHLNARLELPDDGARVRRYIDRQYFPVYPLSWFVQHAGGHVNVAKVDIEGGEYEALYAATVDVLAKVDLFTIETHVWTLPDEPRVEGVGQRPGGPRFDPEWPDLLVRRLSLTHHVDVWGPLDAGATIVAAK